MNNGYSTWMGGVGFYGIVGYLMPNPVYKYLFAYNQMVGWLFGFYGISTFVGYLIPNPFLYK